MNLFKFCLPRLTGWAAIALLLVAVTALAEPSRLPSVIAKLANISLAAVMAYWIDRGVFHYARPDRYLIDLGRPETMGECNNVAPGCAGLFASAARRRAILIGAAMLAMALGV